MKGLMWSIFMVLFCSLCGIAQSGSCRIATWNVENLFDTLHDAGKEDYEYLPSAERGWGSWRYWHKLRGIGQTLAAMGLPSIVALQEVENDTVLRDLTKRTPLWKAGYRYVMTDSRDSRGVDVALLYDPREFSLLSYTSVRVPSEEAGLRPTRDILVCSGRVGAERHIHVVVVHLPSRRNNNASTRRLREMALSTLNGIIDSVGHRGVVVLGDFNAEPRDAAFDVIKGVRSILTTDRKTLRGERGTYCFRGLWGYLDNILVSEDLLPVVQGEARECRYEWLMRQDGKMPRRTYGGTFYMGGLSDHLPLIADFDF